jgi:hypothetical protein
VRKPIVTAIAALAVAGPSQASAPQEPPPPGCQAGQVIQENGQSCLPPVTLPVGMTNLLGLSPSEMSRALSPSTLRRPPVPGCPSGQVLQGNGEACAGR